MKIPVEFDQLDIPFDMQFGDWLPASPGEPKAVLFVPQDLTPEQQAQARKNIGAAAVGEGGGSAVETDAKYFDITDDGLISLKPEYRGQGRAGFDYSTSDNGVGADGSKNHELPENIVIPEIVNEIAVTALAPGMFLKNYAIKSLTIPQYIEEIPERFCDNARNLAELNGTMNVRKICGIAFQRCRFKKAFFPNLEEFEGIGHFATCVYLVIADIGNTITELPSNCFQYCERLSSIIGGANITSILTDGLAYTHNLKNLSFAPNLTSIGDRGLYDSRVNYDWLSHTGCTYGELATTAQWNPTNYWTGCTYTPCNIPLKSTFNQQNPEWDDPNATGEAAYPGNCQCNAAAVIYSAYEDKEISSPVEFINAVKAIDPDLMNYSPAYDDGIKKWLEALGYKVTIINKHSATSLQAVYDALAAGHLVIGGVIGSGGSGYTTHAVVFHGVTENGEIRVVNSASYNATIFGEYSALTYSKPVQNMCRGGDGSVIIVEKG